MGLIKNSDTHLQMRPLARRDAAVIAHVDVIIARIFVFESRQGKRWFRRAGNGRSVFEPLISHRQRRSCSYDENHGFFGAPVFARSVELHNRWPVMHDQTRDARIGLDAAGVADSGIVRSCIVRVQGGNEQDILRGARYSRAVLIPLIGISVTGAGGLRENRDAYSLTCATSVERIGLLPNYGRRRD